jgi:DNA-binding NarL/FixJ family response regulator
LLISDIGLPDGSGLDLMKQLRSRYGMKGIALSGYGTEDDVRRSRAAGFHSHLTKPVTSEALHAAVEAVARGEADLPTDE